MTPKKTSAGLRQSVERAREALSLMGVSSRTLAWPVTLDLLALVLRIVTLTLFLPLIRGVLEGSFRFMGRLRFVRDLFGGTGEVAAEQQAPALLLLGFCIAVAAVLGALCRYLARTTLAKHSALARASLASMLLEKHFEFGQRYYDRTKVARNAARLQRLPARAVRLLGVITGAMRSSASLLLYLGLMAILSWPLALGALVFLLADFLTMRSFEDRLEKDWQQAEESEDRQGQAVHDIFASLPLVRIHGREKQALESFRQTNELRGQIELRHQRLRTMVDQVRDLMSVAVLLALVCVAYFAYAGMAPESISRFVVFFIVLRRSMGSFKALQRLPRRWEKTRSSIDALFSALQTEDKHIVPSGSLEIASPIREIAVRDLSFSYNPKRAVLKGVSLTATLGRMTTLVGPTGSGKTTLLHLLLRLYDCPSMTIRIDGKDVRELDTHKLRTRIGYAGQEPLLFNGSLRENLTYGLGEVPDDAIREACARVQLLDFVEDLDGGLDETIGDIGVRLSSGQKQLIVLARLLLCDPEVILLDEATSFLDATTEQNVLSVFHALTGTKIVISTNHRLATIVPDAWVAVLKRHRIVEEGPRDELIAAGGPFTQLWRAQPTVG